MTPSGRLAHYNPARKRFIPLREPKGALRAARYARGRRYAACTSRAARQMHMPTHIIKPRSGAYDGSQYASCRIVGVRQTQDLNGLNSLNPIILSYLILFEPARPVPHTALHPRLLLHYSRHKRQLGKPSKILLQATSGKLV